MWLPTLVRHRKLVGDESRETPTWTRVQSKTL